MNTVATVGTPRSWDEVTPAWMTEALSRSFPGAVVAEVDLGDLDVGTTTRSTARLTYSAGTGPERVFIKGQGRLDHRLLLASIRCLRPEAWLLASDVELPVDRPQSYAVGIDAPRLNSIVVIEDVGLRGAVPNDATQPLTPERVGHGVEALARLHARFWDRPLPPDLRFLRPWSMFTGWALADLVAATAGVRKLRGLGRPELMPRTLTSPRRVYMSYAECARHARSGPQTLLHGDAHVGNTYSLPDGGVGFYDWQLVRRGCWAHDVGYFMPARSPQRTAARTNTRCSTGTATRSSTRAPRPRPATSSSFATAGRRPTATASGCRPGSLATTRTQPSARPA